MRFVARFFAIATFSAFPIVAQAQGVVLVERPPVYTEGESAAGIVITDRGMEFTLQQVAEHGPDGQMYVYATMLDEGGGLIAHIVFDPRTWLSWWTTETESSVVLSTTCTSDGLYPIVLGKIYECASTIQMDERTLEAKTRMEFDQAEHGQDGTLVGYCALIRDDDAEVSTVSRMCSSSDGKWIRSLQIIESVRRKKT